VHKNISPLKNQHMRTVALLVHPNGEIFAVDNLVKPSEPMHSGYIDEEIELMNSYRRRVIAYREKTTAAVRCDQTIAQEILAKQFPDRTISQLIVKHYDVKNILLIELLGKKRSFFTVGQQVRCIDTSPLSGNSIAPDLEEGKVYNIISIAVDKEGNQHLDVGVVSTFAYITSYETGEILPHSNTIHWCHPIRFEHA
jgi:hypothetical protein